MGTRNITRVISNGQLKVCQYCQWDGYPTGAGRDIIDFLRETDDERMVERLEPVTLSVTTEGEAFYTGAPIFPEAKDIARDEFNFRQFPLAEIKAVLPDHTSSQEFEYINRRTNELLTMKYGPELMQRWRIANRDTGCKILPLIYESANDLTVYSSTDLVDNFGDWQIEGVWQLDYDRKMFTGWWHDFKVVWPFSVLRELTEEELTDRMLDYERMED